MIKGFVKCRVIKSASIIQSLLDPHHQRVRQGESSAAMKRYVKKKRDSSRHSFVRRALGAHQDSLDMPGTMTITNKG